MSRPTNKRQNERGNVLLYILVAVALLAALSFAVAQSGRGNVQQLSAERARLHASEILEYANNINTAINQLTLRGCAENEINFENPTVSGYTNASASTDGFCNIFSVNGGGLNWVQQQESSKDAANQYLPDYLFNATNNVAGLGSFSGELIMFAQVNQEVCVALNTLMAIDPADPPEKEDGFSMHTSFKFTGGYSQVSSINAAYPGLPTACFEHDASDRYYYYKVLIER
jgi:hypothetical protein